jgi:hypothetical protein
MFVYSILEFWGMSENMPCFFLSGDQGQFDWCFAQAFKRHLDFENLVRAEPACANLATKRPEPSIASPPTQRKRQKKTCQFDIAVRQADMGAESVQVICPEDTPNLEDKIVRVLDAVYRNDTCSSMELAVCSRRPPPRERAMADFFLSLPGNSYRGF